MDNVIQYLHLFRELVLSLLQHFLLEMQPLYTLIYLVDLLSALVVFLLRELQILHEPLLLFLLEPVPLVAFAHLRGVVVLLFLIFLSALQVARFVNDNKLL